MARGVRREIPSGLMWEEIEGRVDPSSVNRDMLGEVDSSEIHWAIFCLRPRLRQIVRARFGIGEPHQSLLELGRRLGMTRETVRQQECRALWKMRCTINRYRVRRGECPL